MNLSDRYQKLVRILLPMSPLWQNSILQTWPESRSSFPEEWLQAIMRMNPDREAALDDERWEGPCPPSLRALLDSIQSVCTLPEQKQETAISARYSQGMTEKKRHELQRLLPFLADIVSRHGIRHAVDIGGGMGHLARLCTHHFALSFVSLDQDGALQKKGAGYVRRQRDLPKGQLTFVNAFFSEKPDSLIDPLFAGRETLSIGLHTCGALALHQFQKSTRSGAILNFGCCFDRLDIRSQVNLSEEAAVQPLPWTTQSLFLSTRGRKGKSPEEFALMKRVNSFRFAGDLLMKRDSPELGFVVLGDAPRALYEGSFSLYIEDRLSRLNLKSRRTALEIEKFYSKDSTVSEVSALYAAHLLRSLFARPLEFVLILDRALWLKNRGYEVELLSLFDREISPRNLGIFAFRPSHPDLL